MNPPHSISLRAAKPVFDEGLVFARYLDQAAEGFFRFMLGRQAADIIASAYTHPDNDFSYQHIMFAERNTLIIGMASGYTAEQHRGFSDRPLKQAAGKRALRMLGVAVLCAPLLRFLGRHVDGDFYLQAMAVDKDLRGEGVGSALMDAMEDGARARGSTRLCLDVSPGNEGACRLYRRRGMTVALPWPKFPFIPPLLVRMTKSL